MKTKTIVTMLFTTAAMIAYSSFVFAGEVDILVDKLVEKNILTKSEANVILEEVKREGDKEKEEIKKAAVDAVKEKGDLPDWVKRTKIKGDVRVRYQAQNTDNDERPSRNRGRMRVRLGIENEINDKWAAGIGMASGSDDPRSNNQTFDDVFDTKGWNLDYAYASYRPSEVINITVGKMKNPFYTTKDLIWDSDLNPEGVAVEFNKKLSSNVKFFGTATYFLMEEDSGSKDDPSLLAFQPGLDWKINDKVNIKFAGAYYIFNNVKGSDLSVHTAGTNSTDGSGNWIYDYNSFAIDAELGVSLDTAIPYIAVFGQYVSSDADINDTGWLAGVKLGHKKVKELGDWQFKYNYRKLEQDAWLDFWPDSDFYDGETGVKGSEFEFVMGLSKNVTFGLDYYTTKAIDRNIGEDEKLLQADLIVKF